MRVFADTDGKAAPVDDDAVAGLDDIKARGRGLLYLRLARDHLAALRIRMRQMRHERTHRQEYGQS